MKQQILFVFLTCFSGILFSQIDSNNRYTLIQARDYEQVIDSNFDKSVDTNLNEVFHFDDYLNRNLKFNGVVGSASSEIQPNSLNSSLFGEHVFIKETGNTVLYRARLPFLRASFVQGPKQFQKFDVEFSENINSQLGFSVDYQSLKSTGFYLNQNIDRKRFGFKSYYFSRNGAISSVIGFGLNSGVINENGGIADFNSFKENVNGNKVGVQVSLEEAKNHIDDRTFFYDQEVRVLRLGKDSAKINDGLFVFNGLETHLGDYWYSDFIKDSITDSTSSAIQLKYYKGFGYSLPDSISVTDQYKFEGLRNFAAIRLKSSNVGNMVLTVGLNFKAFRTFNLVNQNEYYGSAFKAVLNRFEVGKLNVNGGFELDLDGYNKGGIHIDGRVGYVIVDSVLAVHGNVSYDKNIPTFKSLRYVNTIVDWDNHGSFDLINEFNVVGKLVSEKYGAFVAGGLYNTSNYVYYESNAIATQYTGRIDVFNLRLGKNLKLGDFHLDVELRHQQKLSDGPLNTPEWVGVASLYHQRFLFARALEIKYGFDYRQTSSYYADAYAPFIREYVYQNEQMVDSYPFVDFYIGMRVKSLQGFVKAQNLCQTFLKDSYMLVPNYPLNDFSVMFGLQWDFFN